MTRAGTTTAFWWGDTIATSQANYDGNYTFGGGAKGEYREKTVPVDSGSWIDVPQTLRAAFRDRYTTVARNDHLGFRVGRTVTP